MADLDRTQLIAMAGAKIADARLLFDNGRLPNAYYLAGYAVELMLKAILAKRFKAETIPNKKLVNDLYSHDLKSLQKLAGLDSRRTEAEDRDPVLAAFWQTVFAWNEGSRYLDRGAEAHDLLRAIEDPDHGVMQWLTSQL